MWVWLDIWDRCFLSALTGALRPVLVVKVAIFCTCVLTGGYLSKRGTYWKRGHIVAMKVYKGSTSQSSRISKNVDD